MRIERVEIFSGQTNAAVMRYPGRHFPGVLIQGDSLHSLCRRADDLCQTIGRGSSAFEEANALRNILQEYLSRYKWCWASTIFRCRFRRGCGFKDRRDYPLCTCLVWVKMRHRPDLRTLLLCSPKADIIRAAWHVR
jgi:hypothetical protein